MMEVENLMEEDLFWSDEFSTVQRTQTANETPTSKSVQFSTRLSPLLLSLSPSLPNLNVVHQNTHVKNASNPFPTILAPPSVEVAASAKTFANPSTSSSSPSNLSNTNPSCSARSRASKSGSLLHQYHEREERKKKVSDFNAESEKENEVVFFSLRFRRECDATHLPNLTLHLHPVSSFPNLPTPLSPLTTSLINLPFHPLPPPPSPTPIPIPPSLSFLSFKNIFKHFNR